MLLKVDVKDRCDYDQFLNSKLITRKIQEMKNMYIDYKNLEKNKEISDGNLLETIRFENILDIKRQLPTKKNYSNNNAALAIEKNVSKKTNKKKDININYNELKNKSNKNINNIIDPSNPNSVKYRKINKNKNKNIIFDNKNIKLVGKNKALPIKTELGKEKEKK